MSGISDGRGPLQVARRQQLLAALQREYQENDLFPATDITEDWLKLTDFDPDNVIKLGPIRPSKPDTVGNAIV